MYLKRQIKSMQKRRQKAKEEAQTYQCRHCNHSYDWHESGYDGKPFLCRCKYYKDGAFSKFLKDAQCAHFDKMKDID